MLIHDKLWRIKENQTETLDRLSKALNISKITANVLVNRGIDTIDKARGFLNPALKDLHTPFLLKDMEKAVARINRAMEKSENIWIYGDYDVDGVTSVSLLKLYFKSVGYDVNYYIPDRFDEGYGINCEAIDYIKSKGGELIISVDCGITSTDEVEYAKSLGIDFIISDHHQCQEIIPKALAVINPKRPDCKYPYDMLAGVGIAFKLIQALTPVDKYQEMCFKYLDIVAFGTVADVAPITGENRIIVKYGLDKLNNTENIGLKALIDVCGLNDKKINSGHIGFVLAPKINAAGRIKDASMGVELLTTDSYEFAIEIAKKLYDDNLHRQSIEKNIVLEAEKIIEQDIDLKKEKVLVLASEGWHHGVIGIAASRIAEKYCRPTIILGVEDGVAKGSARTFGDINIFELLSLSKEYFIKFGGHAQAAGLSLWKKDLEAFRVKINQIANTTIKEKDLVPRLNIDMLLNRKDVVFNVLDEIEKLEPFGLGNPKPQFAYKNLHIESLNLVGKDKNHLKMVVQDGSRLFDCIGFNFSRTGNSLDKGTKVDLVFYLEKNNFKGVETIQFNLKDVRSPNKKIYGENQFVEKYYETFNNILDDMDNITDESITKNVIDMRNEKNRAKFIIDRLSQHSSHIVLVNTIEGFMEIVFELNDRDRNDILNFISFKEPYEGSNSSIVINPQISLIDFSKYENVYVFDVPIYINQLNYIINNSNETYLLYNKDDLKLFEVFLDTIIPNREDLAKLYKFFSKSQPDKFLNIKEIIKSIDKMNISKLYFCLDILEDAKLIETIRGSGEFKVLLLPPPENKINITSTNLYKKINSLKTKFGILKEEAFKDLG